MKEFCPQSCLVKKSGVESPACMGCRMQGAEEISGTYYDEVTKKNIEARFIVGDVIYDSKGIGHHTSMLN
jgi:hypothetical protein